MPLLEATWLKVVQACHFRGSKSRNKVSVGEPAEGSIQIYLQLICKILNLNKNALVLIHFDTKV